MVTGSYVRSLSPLGGSPLAGGLGGGRLTPCAQVEPSGSIWSAWPGLADSAEPGRLWGGGVGMVGSALLAQLLAHRICAATAGACGAGSSVVPKFRAHSMGCGYVGLLIRRGPMESTVTSASWSLERCFIRHFMMAQTASVAGAVLVVAVRALQDCLLTRPQGDVVFVHSSLGTVYMILFYVHQSHKKKKKKKPFGFRSSY